MIKYNRDFRMKIILCLTAFLLVISPCLAFSAHFEGVSGTPDWQDIAGSITINGLPAETGDEVAVFCGNLLVGIFTVTSKGQFGFLHCYGEFVSGTGDGAPIGSELTIKVWQASTKKEITLTTAMMSSKAQEGLLEIKIPLTYQGQKNKYSLNIKAIY